MLFRTLASPITLAIRFLNIFLLLATSFSAYPLWAQVPAQEVSTVSEAPIEQAPVEEVAVVATDTATLPIYIETSTQTATSTDTTDIVGCNKILSVKMV